MRRIIAVVLICAIVLGAAGPAAGQDTVTRYRLPGGTRCQYSGQTYQCYTLAEEIQLLQIDEDLRALTETHAADLAQIAALTHADDELRLSIDAANQQITLLTAERARLTQQWQQADAALRQRENAPDWSWVPWSLAAAFAVTTIVLGLILGLEHR